MNHVAWDGRIMTVHEKAPCRDAEMKYRWPPLFLFLRAIARMPPNALCKLPFPVAVHTRRRTFGTPVPGHFFRR